MSRITFSKRAAVVVMLALVLVVVGATIVLSPRGTPAQASTIDSIHGLA